MTFQLGDILRDSITGFSGTATSRVEYINGCIHYGLVPKIGKDQKAPTVEYFDWQRLELVKKGVAAKTSKTGGPQRDAPK